jgi:hypothetical protein
MDWRMFSALVPGDPIAFSQRHSRVLISSSFFPLVTYPSLLFISLSLPPVYAPNTRCISIFTPGASACLLKRIRVRDPTTGRRCYSRRRPCHPPSYP